MAELLTVKKAADEEIAAKRREEEAPQAAAAETSARRIDRARLESTSIAKFVSAQNLQGIQRHTGGLRQADQTGAEFNTLFQSS